MTYLMPAEWEKHEGTWLAWPHNLSHWPGKFEPVPKTYAEIVRELAKSEKVFICVNDEGAENAARVVLENAGLAKEIMDNVKFFLIPTDASWARDHNAIFVRNESGQLIAEDWIFNAWGNKYKPYDQDDVVPKKVAKEMDILCVETKMVLEGGSIEVNGNGLLLTTEQCLLNPNRNPEMNRAQIEENLGQYLGVKKVLWLKEGIVGDDTDGHIDDIARFTDEKTIVTAYETDEQDENFEILKQNYQDLLKMTDLDGKPLKIVKLPMPLPVVHDGQRLPASYANFYIANSAVLVPIFNCSRDQEALKVMQDLFPERRVVGIDCVDLVWGLGTIHCSTQQQPKA